MVSIFFSIVYLFVIRIHFIGTIFGTSKAIQSFVSELWENENADGEDDHEENDGEEEGWDGPVEEVGVEGEIIDDTLSIPTGPNAPIALIAGPAQNSWPAWLADNADNTETACQAPLPFIVWLRTQFQIKGGRSVRRRDIFDVSGKR